MTTSGFDPEISNANLNAAQYYIDDDGALKFVSPYISSSNFDGTIPVVETTINAENIEPGMLLQVDAGEYLPVISVSYDDVDLESSPSSTITIGYVDSNNELNTIEYNFTDSVDVRYEDWANKDLGNQGWSITSGGNAIFANVGVRGDLEATTLDVGGNTGITYDGTSVVIGASVIINAPVTFNGSGSFVTFNDLSASYALQSFVNTINNRLSASIDALNINSNILTASINFLYNAGFVTDNDLITTGGTFINGNNITTGIINANLVKVESSPLTASAGFKINSLGIYAYNQSNQETFKIESTTGNVFIRGGTLTIGAGASIDGYTTDGELSSGLAGKIDDGQAAADIVTNQTTITGGNIATGRIKSGGYSGPGTGSAFSTTGMLINLDDGGIASKNFRVDPSGNAFFQGNITAQSGYFGNSSYGMAIEDDGSSVVIKSTTLRLGSKLNSGYLHGSLDFYATDNVSIGSLNSAASNKTWYGLGNGIVLGTALDYLFLPSSSNTMRSHYRGSGFEWKNTSNQVIMSIAGGTGGLRINTGGGLTGNGITSSNANIEVTGTGKFVGDGSLLTNLPGGGGGSTPTGTIVMYGGNSAPAGWLFCDGSAVSRSTYSDLWNVLGTSYGSGNGSTTFNLPDFTSTFPRGGTNTDTSRGNTGGQASFTIAEANLPNHNHGVGSLTIGGTSGSGGAADHSGTMGEKGAHAHTNLTATTATEPSHQHGVGTYVIGGSTGNGGAHSHTYTAPNAPTAGIRGTQPGNVVPNVTAGTATSNEPSHSHGVGTLAITGQSGSQGGHSHSVNFNWGNSANYIGGHQHPISIDSHPSHTHGAGSLALTGNTGNWGTATPSSINNQPPYLVVNFIIKT